MEDRSSDERIAAALKSLSVPIRLQILRAIAAEPPLSPSGFIRTREAVTLREAAYHFRALRDAGLIGLDDVRLTAGAAEHRYALTPLGGAVVQALPHLEAAA